MKRRMQRSSSPRQQRRQGRHERGGKPPAPRPTTLVVQVQMIGAHTVGRPLHKDLHTLELALEVPPALRLESGDFVEGIPVGGRGQRLEVTRKIAPNEAATWAAMCNHGLSAVYPADVVEEAEGLPAYRWQAKDKRADLRDLPFVTIDGEDARDFDDAVFAEPDGDGQRIMVAIADVAAYVSEGTLLDAEARKRGNSTYFPDRVLPMLPEKLSNDLCSLRPREDRPVLAVDMRFDGQGRMRGYRFMRGCIFSRARLTYTQVEEVLAGRGKAESEELGRAIAALGEAYALLAKAREARGALDLDLPETKLELAEDGTIKAVGVRPRLTSHRLIEEMMIAANVAAADALSKHGEGGLYRVHPEPGKEKLENLKAVMGPLGFTVPAVRGGPKAWAKLVAQVNGHPAAQTLLRAILQSQQQAKYDPENIGHYGLALPLYAHFTSPIRRYSDLVVHRALIRALGLVGGGGGETWPQAKLARVAESLNLTERTSQMAEWESRDRMVARHFAGLVGKNFEGVVVGVQPFGCFVAVEGVAEGLLPKWLLGESWAYVGAVSVFRKVRGGKAQLRVGSRVAVTLREADVLGGRLTFGPQQEERHAEWQGGLRRARRVTMS